MPNLDIQSGLSPVSYLGGVPYSGETRRFSVPASDGTALYVGDVVKLNGSSDATGKYPGVIKAVIGNVVVGVVTAVVIETAESTIYRAASTLRFVDVAVDPNLEFEVQSDEGGGNLAITQIGLNASFLLGAGSTDTGISGTELDTSTAAVTATLDMQILRLVDRPDNALGANAKVLVRLNNHQYVDGTLGI